MNEFDRYILNRLYDGDVNAFELLFKKYHLPLCHYSFRFTKDIEISKEVVQSLFIWIWENRISLNVKVSLNSYLYRAIHFNSVRAKTKQIRFIMLDLKLAEDENTEEFPDHIELQELEKLLFDYIDKLPAKCAEIFRMSRIDGLKYVDIARTLGISVKTVEAQMGKALRMLRSHFQHSPLILLLI